MDMQKRNRNPFEVDRFSCRIIHSQNSSACLLAIYAALKTLGSHEYMFRRIAVMVLSDDDRIRVRREIFEVRLMTCV